MAMTTKTQKLIEPSDLTAIHFQCKHCSAALSVTLHKGTARIPDACPSCNATWFDPEELTKSTLKEFIEAHRRLLSDLPRAIAVRIELAPDVE
jgi:hypothetical protein